MGTAVRGGADVAHKEEEGGLVVIVRKLNVVFKGATATCY
jgi:hypothetical protein